MKRSDKWMGRMLSFAVFLTLCLWQTGAQGQDTVSPSKGQTVYVPVYSHIYDGDQEDRFYLATTLSIRNTDPAHSITVQEVDYYDSEGNILKKYIDNPVTLKALATISYMVKASDRAGGSGANFIVRWAADKEVNPPLIESVMIGTKMQQGISFTSRGQVIQMPPR
jgi:hypothetical protein